MRATFFSGAVVAMLMFAVAAPWQRCSAQATPVQAVAAGVRQAKAVHGRLKRPVPCRVKMPCAARLAMLTSSAVLVLDPRAGKVLFEKNAHMVLPIASITKLMTALVVVRARQAMAQVLTVTDADVDRLKYSSSRLRVGTRLTRRAMLHIALMSSENRAASALGRAFPGGTAAFVTAMNRTARELGMTHTRFVEPTGLSQRNVSSASDLARLVLAAQRHASIRRYSTDATHTVRQGRLVTVYRNSNRLITSSRWKIGLQKTGYTAEAGRCMVLHAQVQGQPVVMVFLDAHGKFARARDANQVRAWLNGKRIVGGR